MYIDCHRKLEFFIILRSAKYNVGQKVFMQSSLYLVAKYDAIIVLVYSKLPVFVTELISGMLQESLGWKSY